jgi:predicted DNA-binding protein
MASKLVAFRLPEDLIAVIESESKAKSKDKTAVVVNALRHYFELPTSDPTLAAIEGIQKKIQELEEKVSSLTVIPSSLK